MNAFIIKKPIITEKSLALANSDNVYTFRVATNANKNNIKVAIETLYKVDVVAVNTVMNQPEMKKTGKKRLATKQPKKKKAFVTIKDGQTIDLFDVSA